MIINNVLLYNETSFVGLFLDSFTTSITGTLFITFLLVYCFLLMCLLLMKVDFLLAILILLPLAIAFAAFSTGFLVITGLEVILLSLIFVKEWIINRI